MVQLLVRINGDQIIINHRQLETYFWLFLWTIQLNWIYGHWQALWSLAAITLYLVYGTRLIERHYIRTYLLLVLIGTILLIVYVINSVEAISKLAKELSLHF